MSSLFKVSMAPILLLAILACSLATPAAGPATGNTPGQETPAAEAPASASGPCANPLYPVVKGATWTYSTTGGPTGSTSYTDTITDVRADGFTLTSQFDKLTRTQEWACKPEGLLALQMGGQSAGLSSGGMQGQFTTNKAEGVTYPSKPVAAGDEWSYALDYQGQIEMQGGTQATAAGTADFHFKALGTESVSVPAGTFEAMKVQVDTTLKMQVSTQGIQVPVDLTDTTIAWYAPGVGMVKSTDTVASPIYSGTVETQLQSYNIP
jgi:hypothetical protein